MMCYKDMTFCPYYTICTKGDTCFRACTPEVEDRAEEFKLPICMFMEEPECFEPVICPKCKNIINPDMCWCGLSIDKHGVYENHHPIPIGCVCHYAENEEI